MIGVVEVLEGYALKLERLKMPVKFEKGLSILFGPNGCGKSTLLKIVAAYCSIDCSGGNVKTGGWSKLMAPLSCEGKLPDGYCKLTPGKCKAKVEWDGTPTLFADASVTDQTNFSHFWDNKEDSPDGMSGMDDQLAIMFSHPSSGQLRLVQLKKYIDTLKKPAPVITEMPKNAKRGSYNDVWTKSYQKQIDYFNSLPRTGPITFMLDEPDKSLSMENQMQFWTMLIPNLLTKFQVIVATHCPFALIHVNANWIDFDPEYRAKSLEALRKLKPIL